MEYAHLNGADRSLDDLARELTKVRPDQPEYAQVHRLLSKATLKRAAVAWNAHVNPEPDLPPRGKPGIKTPERFRTIANESPPHPIIHFPSRMPKDPNGKETGPLPLSSGVFQMSNNGYRANWSWL